MRIRMWWQGGVSNAKRDHATAGGARMTPDKFFTAITLDPTMTYLGVSDDCVIVRAGRYVWSIDPKEILHDCDLTLAILREEVKPNPLWWMTRVVGYYSAVQNWNRSKVAELHDRGRGEYTVPEIPVDFTPVAWPDDVLAMAAEAGAGLQCRV